MNKTLTTHNLGFPRIGEKRELKRALESFWSGAISADQLLTVGKEMRKISWETQKAAGIDLIPSNDFSFYDQMLDMMALVGAVPQRFGDITQTIPLDTYFAMARGRIATMGSGTRALEMTKWFDTNYHYLVPELAPDQDFRIASSKPFDEFEEAKALGIKTMPVLIGPATFLLLGKMIRGGDEALSLLPRLLPVYGEVLRRLESQGAEWIQVDEPILCTDLTERQRQQIADAYGTLRGSVSKTKLMLATYFGGLGDNRETALKLPIDCIHIDAVRASEEVAKISADLPNNCLLSVGVVDGRNVWRNNFDASLALLRAASTALGPDRIFVSASCSLLHSPLTLRDEARLDRDVRQWLAFAEEKLSEIGLLARLATEMADSAALIENRSAAETRRTSGKIHNRAVKERLTQIQKEDFSRRSNFPVRQQKQRAALRLPLFPITTIGSFPQTEDVRRARAQNKKGDLDANAYRNFLENKTRECVEWQDQAGIDVLVHGEFERNDMVEYFGELLSGFAFTENGWVQSYGSRCVKPPIIFGDISRPKQMTVGWSTFAQSLSRKPMKGMLTGPITILQWSFVRDDQPRRETAMQIALALREEVTDLESAGIRIIQIDEPALREGLPLRRSEMGDYLQWAVDAFKLASSSVRDETQIHTHMCYCEFNDILDSIAALDADVISIETSRSNMELIGAFARFNYPNEIGPGVWDIHSPRIPTALEMQSLLEAAIKVIPKERLWANPDCGLKTRKWDEVKPALLNLVSTATQLRGSNQ